MRAFFFLPLFVLLLLPQSLLAATVDIAQALRQDYPKLKFQKVTPGPFAGIYQVVVDESEIVYYVPAGGYLVTGEIWTPDAKNLTQQAKAELMTQKAGLFPLDKALVIGKGPHQVIEIVDPDCPYCREGSAFFAGRKDVTRYIYLFPLNIHPHAEAKAAYILSAKDPASAYEDVMGGVFDTQPLPDYKDNGLLKEHQLLGQKLGIHGTPQYWVDGRYVPGSNLKLIAQILSDKQN
ncbi:DsbC family protein [Geopsychrobacter electrodiphilus]|uniref:DsbC family protein n=1 Tax=Geopsychrobacter electrodiphilus TaxID=225196 RepID=UPI000371918D|nr:DsbC family protein [Geopsychrobacter electrodiphilus]